MTTIEKKKKKLRLLKREYNISLYKFKFNEFLVLCSPHGELVWGDLSNRVKKVRKTVEILSSIFSYYHESELRTVELKQIALERGLKLLSIPKIFRIRWTKWTYTTVMNLLRILECVDD